MKTKAQFWLIAGTISLFLSMVVLISTSSEPAAATCAGVNNPISTNVWELHNDHRGTRWAAKVGWVPNWNTCDNDNRVYGSKRDYIRDGLRVSVSAKDWSCSCGTFASTGTGSMDFAEGQMTRVKVCTHNGRYAVACTGWSATSTGG